MEAVEKLGFLPGDLNAVLLPLVIVVTGLLLVSLVPFVVVRVIGSSVGSGRAAVGARLLVTGDALSSALVEDALLVPLGCDAECVMVTGEPTPEAIR